MTPLFFPYTYVEPPVMMMLSTIFGKISIYQPLSKWMSSDLEAYCPPDKIEIRVPVTENDEKLKAILKAYRSWADLHQTAHREFHKIIQSLSYATPDPTSSQIRKEIKDRMTQDSGLDRLTPCDHARLFLSLAQEYDLQQSGLSVDIKAFQGMQRQLFKDLKGGDKGADENDTDIAGLSDSWHSLGTEYMVSERLRAWSHLLCRDTTPPCMVITTSKEAFETVSEQADSIQTLSGFDKRPMNISNREQSRQIGQSLNEYFRQLKNTEEKTLPAHPNMAAPASSSEQAVRLTVTVVPNQSPVKLFGNLRHPPQAEPPHPDTEASCRHTVLALMALPVAG